MKKLSQLVRLLGCLGRGGGELASIHYKSLYSWELGPFSQLSCDWCLTKLNSPELGVVAHLGGSGRGIGASPGYM